MNFRQNIFKVKKFTWQQVGVAFVISVPNPKLFFLLIAVTRGILLAHYFSSKIIHMQEHFNETVVNML
jgi:hypothetical protein